MASDALTIDARSNDSLLPSSLHPDWRTPTPAIVDPWRPPSGLLLLPWTIAGLSLLFQVGHFAEHAIQFGVWIAGRYSDICGRDTPWMSPWVSGFVEAAGDRLFPSDPPQKRMMLSMELLHLIGNSIFLTGLFCLYVCIRSKIVKWAVFIELFHLYEHVMLTTTAFYVGKPIGLSTLFGASSVVGSREFSVGFRVSWHFFMNLLPMPLAMDAIWRQAFPKFNCNNC